MEHEIHARTREELLYLLAEAAEIEHNLMCCYLFAAFSLKDASDGLTEAQAAEVQKWKRGVVAVAIEEMTHLTLVSNLMLALGGAPHLGRANFPVASGYHPSDVIVELRRFDRATLDHFIYLERPEGVELPDGLGFVHRDSNYVRDMAGERLMPNAQDYATVGHLYRGIRRAIEAMCERRDPSGIFVGDPALQVGPHLAGLPGLLKVVDKASALKALEVIVEQGEGSGADVEHSHYRRFLAIREAFAKFQAETPDFDPARPVAPNPVMRPPPNPRGKTYIDKPAASAALDLANAAYGAMLRALAQGFAEREPKLKRAFIDIAIEGMFGISPLGEHLTRLPASTQAPGFTAGMTFAMLRDVSAAPDGIAAAKAMAERLRELADGAPQALGDIELADKAARQWRALADKLSAHIPAPKEAAAMTTPETIPAPAANSGVETAEGRDLTILFDAKRCIHARFCVLQEPGVFKANVVGPWIAPDDATSTENLIAVARNCPSGAIQYRRMDGGAAETPPPVNLIQVRENGPLAFRGGLSLNEEAIGTRATLCRCGASKNKPYCDGSHKEIDFSATGEPATGDVTPLAARDGLVAINPTHNGPLAVVGNLEVTSGTGRTIAKATELYLCRCGGSANKPYCDGTHARIGFQG